MVGICLVEVFEGGQYVWVVCTTAHTRALVYTSTSCPVATWHCLGGVQDAHIQPADRDRNIFREA